jgi:hypothetical protein
VESASPSHDEQPLVVRRVSKQRAAALEAKLAATTATGGE